MLETVRSSKCPKSATDLAKADLCVLELRMSGFKGRHVLGEKGFDRRHCLCNVDLSATDVVVDVDDVKMAVSALGDEVLQETKSGGATSIGDSWRCKADLPRKRLDVVLVYGSRLRRRQIGLVIVIGFVRTVDMVMSVHCMRLCGWESYAKIMGVPLLMSD